MRGLSSSGDRGRPRQAAGGSADGRRRRRSPLAAAALALLALRLIVPAASAEERRNWFNDPFVQATRGLAACPAPEGPLLTEEEMRRQSHQRIERGTSCWLAGKCAEANAYADDARINSAAAAALAAEPRLGSTSLWVTTQRRFVFVQGCVREAAQKRAAIDALRRLPEVDYVADETMVGTRGKPPYRSAVSAPRN